ncbi:DUF748 domain-containing protein [Neolewinella sp.]|uniref:DUF748 domain-containing protein n=1 Tax=Neolewinella sp. TaxID=2993543 RepID=UPI003B516063
MPDRPFYRRKRFIIPAVVVLLLVAFRLYLPTLVKNYVNKTLAELPGYYGQVADIDIALLRGAYVIKGMYLNVVNGATEVPFLKLPQTDISVEWKSLFKGRVVSEIYLTSPEVIYLLEDQESLTTEESPSTDDWTKALTDLVPIDINHLEIIDGKLAYVEVNAEPNIDLEITKLRLVADNLSNVVAAPNTLPSPVTASGVSFGGGAVKLDGKVNLLREVPDVDLTFSLEGASATALNDWTRQYVGIDFESGTFEVFSEVAIADGFMKGYIKPLLTDGKLIGKDDSFTQTVWEGFVGFFKFLFTNQKTDTLGTEVAFEGDLTDPQVKIWPTVTNIFKNAWIKAFSPDTDDSIDYQDALNRDGEGKSKKELRQERRAKRRAEKGGQ